MQKIKFYFLVLSFFSNSKLHLNQAKPQEFPKAYDMFPGFFPQPKKLLLNKPNLEKNRKHCPIYDGFKTVALFDLVKVDDKVLACQEIIKGEESELSKETIRKKILNQIKNNNDKITFYVLADIRAGNKNLASQNPDWNISLQVKNLNLKPKITNLETSKILEEIFDKNLRISKNKNKFYKLEFFLPEKDDLTLKKTKNSEMNLTFKSINFKKSVKFKSQLKKRI